MNKEAGVIHQASADGPLGPDSLAIINPKIKRKPQLMTGIIYQNYLGGRHQLIRNRNCFLR